MLYWSFAVLFVTFTAPASAAAGQNICEDINAVSNGWNAVANALEEAAGDDLGDLDVESLASVVNELLEPTGLLGEVLAEEGDEGEQELGEDLLDIIDEMLEVDGDDLAEYLVDVIDDLVDTLDEVVDYCDAA